MSGTSLDGLDVALCEFWRNKELWSFNILKAETYQYTDGWDEKLRKAHTVSGFELIKLDHDYGIMIGKCVKNFIQENKLRVDYIASHGHTVFHKPDENVTLQVGNGAFIASETGISTISNFRLLDVALKGQGAPLVPIGDLLLFPQYDYCLNLGGFANISYSHYKKRLAFDICPVNFVINHYSRLANREYDHNGTIAEKGKVDKQLLTALNKLEFYNLSPPKSLGREWVETSVFPLINNNNLAVEDILRTFYEHIVRQITLCFTGSDKKILVTGGGAHNKFLISLIRKKVSHKIIVPDDLLVDYKEALIFAFLGLLRARNENNCLASVTGAKHDNIGGIIYLI